MLGITKRISFQSFRRFSVAALLLLGGCAGFAGEDGQVTYHDRDHDGKVDLEKHRYSGSIDRDWQLRDDNFDGRYEKKVIIGVGIITEPVDLPVPTGVRIKKP